MSLDNSNPTIVHNATGEGRKRFKNLRLPHAKAPAEQDELDVMSMKEILKKDTLSSYPFLLRKDEALEKKVEHKVDYIDSQEIYNLISTISDPEHPLSLGSLAVVRVEDIYLTPSSIDPTKKAIARVLVEITPTVTHCSLATVIGLGIRVRLEQSLPPNIRVDVRVKDGTHSSGDQANKQLADKERVAAALENATLLGVVKKMLETCE